MMLRRLTAGQDTSAVETLVSVIEPVKEYRRYRVRPQTMLSPLTGLVDAARPDAPGARAFNKAVDEMLAGVNAAENSAKIRSMVNEWRAAEPALLNYMENSPALVEAAQLSADFRRLNQVILDALEALEKRSPQSAEWRDARNKILDEVAKPKAALEFVVIARAKKLVEAAAVK